MASFRAGVVWFDPGQVDAPVVGPPEMTRFQPEDGGFILSFYAPPPATALHRLDEPATGRLVARLAFGEIVLYDDLDGDGTFAIVEGDPYARILGRDRYSGAAKVDVMTYLEVPLPDASLDGLPALKGVLAGPIGYAITAVGCTLDQITTISRVGVQVQVPVIVDQEETVDLPFERKCLRTAPGRADAGFADTLSAL